MKTILLAWKDLIRSKNSLLILSSVAFAMLIPIVLFSASNTFMTVAETENTEIFGSFDNILYRANEIENTDNFLEYTDSFGTIYVYETIETPYQAAIGYADEGVMKLGNIQLLSGAYPEEPNEILICNSVVYKSNSELQVGDHINLQEDDYIISGIINDYYSLWNKPENSDVIFPTILLNGNGTELDRVTIQEHVLLKNYTSFPQEYYLEYNSLIANSNKIINNHSGRYQIPSFVIVLTCLCAALLNLYTYTYFFQKERKKIAIFRCLGMTKVQALGYYFLKILLLLVISILLGALVGYGISTAVIGIFNAVLNQTARLEFSIAYFLESVLICLLSAASSIFLAAWNVCTVSPMEQIRGEAGISPSKSSRLRIKKYKRSHIIRLAAIEARTHWKASLLIVFLLACAWCLFLFISVYMSNYASRLNDVAGRMPLTFDYEFWSEQTLADATYVDEQGNIVEINSTPNSDSVIFVPDHDNIISDTVIQEIRDIPQVDSVKRYLEVNDIYLLNAPEEENNPYLSGCPNDSRLTDSVSSHFQLTGNTRSMQYLGFSEAELMELEPYIAEGSINLGKIRSGEEVILMVPSFELIDLGDGFTATDYLTQEEYTGKSSQFQDTTYSVGDELTFIQLVPTNSDVKGYLSEDEMKSSITYQKYTVKIGAIVRQRVAWFDNLSQPPTAYTLLGLNDSIYELGMQPTFSRIQIYLSSTTTYEEFDPIIQYYQDLLDDFGFRNNAAEMQSYKEYLLVLYTLCFSLVGIVAIVVMVIIGIEEKITLQRNLQFYSLLRLNGLTFSELNKLLVVRSACTAAIVIVIFTLSSKILGTLTFGAIFDPLNTFCGGVLVSCLAILTLWLILAPVLMTQKIRKKLIIQLIQS